MRARRSATAGGDDAGFYALCFLALALMIYQALAGQVFGDVAAVLFVFSSVGSFARYRMDRDPVLSGHGHSHRCLCLGSLGVVRVAYPAPVRKRQRGRLPFGSRPLLRSVVGADALLDIPDVVGGGLVDEVVQPV